MDRLDMCEANKLHKVPFVLNPTNEWEAFPPHLLEIIKNPWTEFKYFSEDSKTINSEISTVPNTTGGIYLFLIRPNIIPSVPAYLAYIGRAHISDSENLRKRVRQYATETKRLKILEMKHYWSPHLYLRYLPLSDNATIDAVEDELIKAILPPYNDRYPGVYNQAMRDAF